MKRFLFLLLISFVGFNSFANDINISEQVKASFYRSFQDASEVTWTAVDDFYKASFMLNEERISAFYDQSGKMIALTRNISSKQLPFNLQTVLKKEYGQYWISDLFEMNSEGGTSYFVTLENADSKIVMKSGLESGWSLYKKIGK